MFRKILVPLDGSPIAEQAVPVAATLARASRAAIDFIHVHEPGHLVPGRVPADIEQDRWHAEHRYVEGIAEETRATADVLVTHAAPAGNPAEMIRARALDEQADLIVMTSHGRTGFSRTWLGSVADAVVRTSRVPVLMVRAMEAKPRRTREAAHCRRILVPLDGSALAQGILETAAALARCEDGTLLLLRVVQPVPSTALTPPGLGTFPGPEDEDATRILVGEAQRDLARAAQDATAMGAPRVESQVVVDHAVARAILDFAGRHHVDAIAMSTHGRGASRLLVGSVADKVLRGWSLPILLRRPEPVAQAPEELAPEIEEQLSAIGAG